MDVYHVPTYTDQEVGQSVIILWEFGLSEKTGALPCRPVARGVWGVRLNPPFDHIMHILYLHTYIILRVYRAKTGLPSMFR